MKKRLKKGFTIVELVIVIAVIAILASVLLPGFTEIIARANLNKYITFCTNLNKMLAIEDFSGKANSVEEIMELLLSKGYSTNDFKPASKDHFYIYDHLNNRIALVSKSFEIKYKDKDLSDDLWVLVESEELANEISSNYFGKYKFLLIEADGIKHISVGDQVLVADENNVQEIINGLTSVDSVVKLIVKDDSIKNNIVINQSNALTLDLGGKELDGILFENSVIENYGELKIINGNLVNKDNACIIENSGKMILENVNLQSFGTNGDDATIVNYGTLSLVECDIFSTATSCIKNETSGTLTVSGGKYECDCGANIVNYGMATINDGEFVRNSNNVLTGSTGSSYAVIINETKTTNAQIVINNGRFTNKYVTMPKSRILSVIFNQNGEVEINGGKFENMCNNKLGYAIYSKGSKSKVDLNGGEYIVSNLNAAPITCASGVNKNNITISNIIVRGTENYNLDSYVVENSYIFFNYLKGDLPCIELTDKEPDLYGARVNNTFYLDVNFITSDLFTADTFIVINDVPQNFKIMLDRAFLGEENSISVVYGKEMDEIIFAAEDYVLQKIDIKTNFPDSFSAFKYYSYISSETATFKAEYSDGAVDYFSFAEWDLAYKNAVKLTLLKDIDTKSTVELDLNLTCDITLDLNGKTWKESGSVNYMLSIPRNIYTLTIIDSSTAKTGSMIFDGSDSSYGLLYLGGSVVIDSGNFESNGNVFYMAGSDDDKDYDYLEYTYLVEGGVFIGKIYQSQCVYHGTYVFKGGIFSDDPSDFLDKNCSVSKNSDGLYEIILIINSTYDKSNFDLMAISELKFVYKKENSI